MVTTKPPEIQANKTIAQFMSNLFCEYNGFKKTQKNGLKIQKQMRIFS